MLTSPSARPSDLLPHRGRLGGGLVSPGADRRLVEAAVTDLLRDTLGVDDCWLQPPGAFAEQLLAAYGEAGQDVSLSNTAAGPLAAMAAQGRRGAVAVALARVTVEGEDHVLVAWRTGVRAWTSGDRRLVRDAVHQLVEALGRLAGTASAEQHARARFDELRTDLMVTLDHELRTPMTVLRSGLELLEDALEEQEDGEHAWLLERLGAGVDRLRGLADSVGALARETRPPSTSVEVGTPLHPTVEEAVDRVAARDGLTRVSVAGHADVGRPAVAIEAQDLRLVVTRLVENAAKFTEGDDAVVEVTVHPADGGVELVVSDRGIGIADDEHFGLGEAFFRTSETKRREHQGPGLGLAVVRSVLQRWGGRLVLGRRSGGGTEARVWLPLAAGPGQEGASKR